MYVCAFVWLLRYEPKPCLFLSSPCSLPEGVTDSKEVRENLGITVHYNIKVRCNVAFGS